VLKSMPPQYWVLYGSSQLNEQSAWLLSAYFLVATGAEAQQEQYLGIVSSHASQRIGRGSWTVRLTGPLYPRTSNPPCCSMRDMCPGPEDTTRLFP
jgi:hypothetical protein